MAFCVWLVPLSIMFSRFITLQLVSVLHSFLWLNNIPLYGQRPHFVYLFINAQNLICFHHLIIVNRAANFNPLSPLYCMLYHPILSKLWIWSFGCSGKEGNQGGDLVLLREIFLNYKSPGCRPELYWHFMYFQPLFSGGWGWDCKVHPLILSELSEGSALAWIFVGK